MTALVAVAAVVVLAACSGDDGGAESGLEVAEEILEPTRGSTPTASPGTGTRSWATVSRSRTAFPTTGGGAWAFVATGHGYVVAAGGSADGIILTVTRSF